MNVFEVLKDTIAPFMDGEKRSLHIGEAFNLWAAFAALEEALHTNELYYNVVDDPELKEKLHEFGELKKTMINEVKEIMSAENVSFPKQTPSIPLLDSYQPPTGGKLTDEQIANKMIFNVTVAIQWYARWATESLRADVGMYFTKNILKYITFAATLKPLMIKNGWLKVPPDYKP